MAELPVGTVTFLFTDIEGSTNLLRQLRDAYGDATMWLCVAALGVTAGILGLVAARGHDAEAAAVGSPA